MMISFDYTILDESSTVVTGSTVTNARDQIKWLYNSLMSNGQDQHRDRYHLVLQFSTTALDSGTASAGASTTLTDGSKSWTTNAYANQVRKITGDGFRTDKDYSQRYSNHTDNICKTGGKLDDKSGRYINIPDNRWIWKARVSQQNQLSDCKRPTAVMEGEYAVSGRDGGMRSRNYFEHWTYIALQFREGTMQGWVLWWSWLASGICVAFDGLV